MPLPRPTGIHVFRRSATRNSIPWTSASLYLDFQEVSHEELDSLDIGISVLGPSQALTFDSQQMLLAMLRPGQDGLILQDGNARGTFLPAVWKSLPEPTEFLDQLKMKAGLAADYWSDSLEVWRYSTESFNAPVSGVRNLDESTIRTG